MSMKEQGELIDELLDGSISDADFLRLEAEMRVDPEVRQAYYTRLKLNNALKIEVGRLVEETDTLTISFWRRHAQLLAAVAAIGLFAFVGLSGWKMGRLGATQENADTEPLATGFAILAEYSDTTWLNHSPFQRGDLLPQGPIKLGSGIAELEFFSGVTVIVEGESEFEIHSPMEMTVTKGRMRALVPTAARGFKVSTAAGDVIDLGTEFALEVSPDGAEMHVLQGEIEWHPNSDEKQLLIDGESMRWTESGGSSEITVDPRSFSTLGELEQRFQEQKAERKNAWNHLSSQLAEDPRVLAFYPVMDILRL